MNFQLQNLSISYDHHIVKRNINISAESGQLICLIGEKWMWKINSNQNFIWIPAYAVRKHFDKKKT